MKKILSTFLLIALYTTIFGQHTKIKFESLTKRMGLSNANIQSIIQDSDGYMWFGSEDGLSRYDGVSFQNFRNNPEDSTSLITNKINWLYEDNNRIIWIATSQGISKYNMNTKKIERTKFLPQSYIFSLLEHNDKLYISSQIGIYSIDKTSGKLKKEFENVFGSEEIEIRDIKKDKKNNLWVLCNNAELGGLYKYSLSSGKFERFHTGHPEYPLEDNVIYSLYIDENDKIYIGYSMKGMSILDLENKTLESFKYSEVDSNSLSSNEINTLAKGKDGKLYIGTGYGLNIFDPKSKLFYRYFSDPGTEKSLLSNTIQNIFVSNSGTVWIGSRSGGVNIYDKRLYKFELYKYEKHQKGAISSNTIEGMTEDIYGNIWIATDGGGLNLYHSNSGIFTTYKNIPGDNRSISNNKTLAVTSTPSGELWVGLWQGGINRFKISPNGELKLIKKYLFLDKNSENSNCVFKLVTTKSGKIWVGTWKNGLYYYDSDKDIFARLYYPRAEEYFDVDVMDIFEDSFDNVWIATGGYGLIKYNTKNNDVENYRISGEAMSISGNTINAVYEDKQKKLWAGTNFSGLELYDREKNGFYNFSMKDGLPSNSISGILDDALGNLWISTTSGISKVSVKDKNGITSIKCRNFNIEDGLQDMQFNTWAYLKSKDGRIFFGGINGLNIFRPDSIKNNTQIPPVYFSDFLLFNKKVMPGTEGSVLSQNLNLTEKIVLNHDQSVITFRYVALNYIRPDKNQYAYKMEGFDKDWHYVGNRKEATYTNLDPDEYTFKVKASNNDGQWNETGKSIKLVILPPWWKTWWFTTLWIATIVVSVTSFYLVRMNAMKRQKAVLEKRVKARTKDLMAANAELEEKQEEIQQQAEELIISNDTLQSQQDELKTKNQLVTKAYDNIQQISIFGQKITSTLEIKSITLMLYKFVQNSMHTTSFGIGLYKNEINSIIFTDLIVCGKKIDLFSIPLSETNNLVVRCLQKEGVIYLKSPDDSLNYYSKNIDLYLSEIPKSAVFIPLKLEDKLVGVITIQSDKLEAYTDEDIAVLQSIGSFVSIGLDNAKAYQTISEKKSLISSSINYAKTIQNAILPTNEKISRSLFDSFIIYRPKDVVSGDFYWYTKVKIKTADGKQVIHHFVAVVDCTGHGVPGAFMSMIGYSILNEIVKMRNVLQPSKILELLDNGVVNALQQKETGNDDGMDVCLCRFDEIVTDGSIKKAVNVVFSGAKRPLLHYSFEKNKISTYKGDVRGIGGNYKKKIDFTDYTFSLIEKDILYLSSDGLADQNDPKRKRFSTKLVIKILENNATEPFEKQKELLELALEQHQQKTSQRDDISFIGLKLKSIV